MSAAQNTKTMSAAQNTKTMSAAQILNNECSTNTKQ